MQRLVVGPFKVTGNQFYDSTPLGASRMEEVNPEHGVFKEVKISCPWRIPFDADGFDMSEKVVGLKWDFMSKEFGINPDIWRNLINCCMPVDDIEALANRLREINN
ncbi:MAG: hypothetical protein ABIF08_02060 [Nanoarchaeota archaeon]